MILSAAAGASSGAVVSVGLDIYAVNNFSGPAAQAGMSLKQLQSEFRRTMYENLRVARNMYGGMAAAGAILTRGMHNLYRRFADFDYMMVGTQVVSRATEEQLGDLRNEALRLGETTMFYADDIANSMREMAKSGMEVDDIMNNIRASVAGAGASMEGLNVTTKAIISTLAQFQIPSEHAMDVMDKIAAAALGSKSTIGQLSDALKYSAADFYALGIPLETALGMLMTMHNFGIEASMAGTAMGNALRYMAKAQSQLRTGRQAAALDIFGLTEHDFQTPAGDFKEMVDVFGILAERIAELPTIRGQVAMEALFGIRGKRAAFPMAAATEQVARNIERVANSAGMAQENLEKMMDTPHGDFLKMVSAWKTTAIALGSALEPAFRTMHQVLRGLGQAITWVTQARAGNVAAEIFKYIASGLALFTMINTVVFGIKAAAAGVMMMITSNRISFANMNRSMATGWAMLKQRAMGYKHVVDGITVSHMRLASAQLVSTAGGMRMIGGHGLVGTASRTGIGYTAHGRPYTRYPMSDISTRRTYAANRFIPFRMAPGMGGRGLGQGALQQMPAQHAKKGILGGLLKGTGGALAKAGAFLMGWKGLVAFMLLGPAISGLTRIIRGNTRAVEENTRTQRDYASHPYRVLPRYDEEFFNRSDLIERLLAREQVRTELAGGTLDVKGKKVDVIFNVDGKNMVRTTVDERTASSMYKLGL